MAGNAPWVLSQVQVVAEAVATLAFALSGVIEGARKRLDAVGICVVAGLAAFGGGTVRDVVLDRRPLFWVEHAGWLWALLALCIGAMAFMRARHLEPTERAMQWPDALGQPMAACPLPKSYVNCRMDSALPQSLGWHPRLSERLGLFRYIECSGSHEVWFTDPAAIAAAIEQAGRD